MQDLKKERETNPEHKVENQVKNSPENESLVHKLPEKNFPAVVPVLVVLVVLMGTFSGWILSSLNGTSAFVPNKSVTKDLQTESHKRIDEENFPLVGEGTVEEGGSGSDGTHSLVRPGQPSVTLTSTVISLDSFTGKKVRVWGETLSPVDDKTEWLVDVVRVKVLE